ncbi:MAG: GNAT family N-acetyltransferase [Anaerolineae bacterium]|nr:GNAT family N-acetyltransferase [Anaerolineae bacterium]
MFTSTTTFQRPLGNNLVLKSIETDADIDRLAAFNAHIHGPELVEMTRSLILNHPTARPEYWLFVEDESTNQIVSSLALIPWHWRYEDVTLKSGEMGIVGTLEAYRGRGLIRALDTRFKELLREGDFDISHIQGIPYFYRQFGYEYAMPLEPMWQIELPNIPAASGESPYHFRLATTDDIPALMHMYDEAARDLDISTLRDADIWRCIFGHPRDSGMAGEIWLMLDADEHPVGYGRVLYMGFGTGLIVSEASRLSHPEAIAFLGQFKTLAAERGKPNVRLALPDSNPLLQAARGWGAHNSGTYAWQIHLVDVARLLRKLAPVLERRLAASPFAGLTQKVNLNLYRETFELDFERGQLRGVTNIGFVEGGELRIPPLLLAPLLLGYRGRDQLRESHPDFAVWGQSGLLIDTLFPRMSSFLCENY